MPAALKAWPVVVAVRLFPFVTNLLPTPATLTSTGVVLAFFCSAELLELFVMIMLLTGYILVA
ncbi:hypothetical protein D9M71_823490 [compost metagenome]|jgi:hypothetical protein